MHILRNLRPDQPSGAATIYPRLSDHDLKYVERARSLRKIALTYCVTVIVVLPTRISLGSWAFVASASALRCGAKLRMYAYVHIGLHHDNRSRNVSFIAIP